MDTHMAVKHANELGALTVSICNPHGSTIPRESDAVLYTHAGPEIAVASTKAYLAQISACYLLGLYLAQLRGGFDGGGAIEGHERRGRAWPTQDLRAPTITIDR